MCKVGIIDYSVSGTFWGAQGVGGRVRGGENSEEKEGGEDGMRWERKIWVEKGKWVK
jgi:hypothetical protein